MSDHQRCRLSDSGAELELAGPPVALRALGGLLRRHAEPFEVAISGGTVTQEVTGGPLFVGLQGETTLCLSGGREYLAIFWDALDGVADQAETADDRVINRHQHIEYVDGDEFQSPRSIPMVIVADWPEEPVRATH